MWNQITNKHIFIFMIIKRVNNRTRYAHYQKQVWIEVKLFYFRQEDIRQGYWMSQRHAKWSYTYIFDFLNMIFIHSEIDWAKRKGLKFEMLAYQRRFVFFFFKVFNRNDNMLYANKIIKLMKLLIETSNFTANHHLAT